MREAEPTGAALEAVLALSRAWAAEESCRGYAADGPEDLAGRRLFLAEEAGETLGYLFGRRAVCEAAQSIMPAGTPFFEVEELYVAPARRRQGIGAALFRFAEEAVRGEAELILLSTASRDWRAILRLYIDELDMRFWHARLFKPIAPGRSAE